MKSDYNLISEALQRVFESTYNATAKTDHKAHYNKLTPETTEISSMLQASRLEDGSMGLTHGDKKHTSFHLDKDDVKGLVKHLQKHHPEHFN